LWLWCAEWVNKLSTNSLHDRFGAFYRRRLNNNCIIINFNNLRTVDKKPSIGYSHNEPAANVDLLDKKVAGIKGVIIYLAELSLVFINNGDADEREAKRVHL